MTFRFPLKDVSVNLTDHPTPVEHPAYSDDWMQLNQTEFALDVEGVARFYACNGKHIEICPEKDADSDWINLHLNGFVLVAILHQRSIINFHASSFIHNGKGIILLGESGAGKSSMTAAFSLNGAGFLSDDLTPVIFKDDKPLLWPIHKIIKLRDHTIEQLEIDPRLLKKAEKGTGKYFLDIKKASAKEFPLDLIFKIEIGTEDQSKFIQPDPVECFSMLRSEICSWEMLAGMPETETSYLQQLISISSQVRMVKVIRPENISVSSLYEAIKEYVEFSLITD